MRTCAQIWQDDIPIRFRVCLWSDIPNRPKLDQLWPSVARLWNNLAELGAKDGPHWRNVAEFGRTRAKFETKLAQLGPTLATSATTWPTLTNIGQN